MNADKNKIEGLRRAILESAGPLSLVIAGALRAEISAGRIAPGERLPSTRSLARAAGVSRNTVLAAYEELASEGLIVGKIGSCTRVRGQRILRRPGPAVFLRAAQYPLQTVRIFDPDGHSIELVRSW